MRTSTTVLLPLIMAWAPMTLAAQTLDRQAREVAAETPGPAMKQAVEAAPETAEQLLQASGVRGGLVVWIGCRDGLSFSDLGTHQAFVFQALDTDPGRVAAMRKRIRAAGAYGRVSADTFDGACLPYIDGAVNLLVMQDVPSGLRDPASEIGRVLAPRGVAMVQEKETAAWLSRIAYPKTRLDSGFVKLTKPVPSDIDQWTHYLHGPDNNALSHDLKVGPPRHMQWLCGPLWTRDHGADKKTYPTVRAVVSAAGRLYYLLDETRTSNMTVDSRWTLVARDGFSGVRLWEKAVQAKTYPRLLEQVWRQLVAEGDRVYAQMGTGQALSELDGATGRVLQTYQGTEGFEEVIKDGGRLFFVDAQHGVRGVDAASGATPWTWQPGAEGAVVPLTLAAAGGRVFVKTEAGVSCLAAGSGAVLWQHALPGSKIKIRLSWPRERLLVQGGVVLVSFGGGDPRVLNQDIAEFLGSHPRVRQYGGRLAALRADDGTKLWESPYMPNLESAPGEVYVNEGRVWLGPDFAEARDLASGAVVGGLKGVLERLWTDGHHHRCYPGKATSRYLITAKRGIELFDMHGDAHSRNNWVRATCRVGVTPSNGLIYAPPHSCGCYMEAMLHGFWALAGERPLPGSVAGTDAAPAARLEQGPAYGDSSARPRPGEAPGWTTYRGDSARSGCAAGTLPKKLVPRWSTRLGGRLSAPTAARGKVFVAEVDAHTVHALDAPTGRDLWQFTAGGRVDSPPTLYEGLVLFGSADGWVYCLRAADGVLRWRFRAAPGIGRAVAFEQVESLWPVHGSVLVYDGIAYVAAGRSSYLDGGIAIYGLDPFTGAVLVHRQLTSEHAGLLDPPANAASLEKKNRQNWSDYKTVLAPDHSDSFSMAGARTDILTAEGGSIFMQHLRFSRRLASIEDRRPHLFSTSGLLDGTGHNRSYWVLGTADFRNLGVSYPWILKKNIQTPYGLMMVFDEKTVWSVHRTGRKKEPSGCTLVALPRPDPADPANARGDFEPRGPEAHAQWTADLPLGVRAMVCGGDVLAVGGLIGGPGRPLDEAADGGTLVLLSARDGAALGTLPLEASPVWDGMAADAGRLYLALENGVILCLGGK